MTEMTPEQIAYIRAKSGDNCAPYVASLDTLQIYFDAAEGDLPTTIVSVLEDRWAAAKAEAGKVTDFGTAVDRANVDHIEDLLDYWRKRAGIVEPGVTLSSGEIGLGLDATCESEFE